jgi:Icc-related predicted phosphoesterase
MKILSLSDKIIPFIYSPQVRRRFDGTELVIGCGDLAYYYLEYVLTALNVPLFFVRGNHDKVIEYSSAGQRTSPHGGVDLHRKVINYRGIILAGVDGSLRYKPGRFQHSQADMWRHVLRLTPGMLINRLKHGRFLDIFVTHAPPAGIHDQPDLPHQGIKAFQWLITVFQPAYHFHGHVHVYRPDTVTETTLGRTRVINTYGFRETRLML